MSFGISWRRSWFDVKLAALTQTSQKYPQLPKNKGVRTRTVIDKFIAYYIEILNLVSIDNFLVSDRNLLSKMLKLL
jgi:hypothetical protein